MKLNVYLSNCFRFQFIEQIKIRKILNEISNSFDEEDEDEDSKEEEPINFDFYSILNANDNASHTNSNITINIQQNWFHSNQKPLFADLNAEIMGNFPGEHEQKLYKDVKAYARSFVQSKWNKKMRLCLNEVIALRLFIESDLIRNELSKSFEANSSILERRKHFHLAYTLKKALLYAGLRVNNNVNEIGIEMNMIAPTNNNDSFFVILSNQNVSKTLSHLNVNFDDDDEKLNVNVQITEFLNFLVTKSEELKNEDLLGSNQKIASAIRNNKFILVLSKHSLLFSRTARKKTKNWLKAWVSEKRQWIEQLYNTETSKSLKCATILCLLKGIDLKSLNHNEDKKILKRMGKHSMTHETLIQYLENSIFDDFKSSTLTYSVHERLINEFELRYLPFATMINVQYSGIPNAEKVKAKLKKDNPDNKELAQAIENERYELSNLFEYGRTISVCVNHLHLFIDALSKLEQKSNVNSIAINFKMKYRFVPKYDDEYKHEPGDNVEWYEYDFVFNEEAISLLSNDRTLELRKIILHSLEGFVFHKHLVHNRFEYELLCLLNNFGNKDEFIQIDKGHFDVNMDCIVMRDYVIESYEYAHDGIFEFQSLRICNEAKLTVLPFGNISPNKYLMGLIRIRCHQNIIIEEDCSLNVNGKGYYGDNGTHGYSENPGRGQRKAKKKDGEVWYYAGGGYGSNGGDCFAGNTRDKLMCRGGAMYGDKRLETLHFGSSGGKGGLIEDLVSDRGGGIIELHTDGMLENYGSITSNGTRGQKGGKYSGGSGGSIKIICHSLVNEGMIQAKGSKGFPPHGDGGNGRIAIYHNRSASNSLGSIEPKRNLHVDEQVNAPTSSVYNNLANGDPLKNETPNGIKKNKSKKKKRKKLFGLF